jgi:ATP-dependent RNA helicase RhlE
VNAARTEWRVFALFDHPASRSSHSSGSSHSGSSHNQSRPSKNGPQRTKRGTISTNPYAQPRRDAKGNAGTTGNPNAPRPVRQPKAAHPLAQPRGNNNTSHSPRPAHQPRQQGEHQPRSVHPQGRKPHAHHAASAPAAVDLPLAQPSGFPGETAPAMTVAAAPALPVAAIKSAAGAPAAPQAPVVHFTDLGLADPILEALRDEGYDTPTPIQARAIPPVLQGRDILGSAQTGTGKTAAFALPVLHRMLRSETDKSHRGPRKARCLVLSPTRELATQIGESFAAYGRHTGLTHTCIFGGVGQGAQVRSLNHGVDIIVATPGRLIDLMEQRLVNLSGVTMLVLDEADRMLDMGFIMPIRRIAAALPTNVPRQTLMFSATMPREIRQLAETLLRDPVSVAVSPVASAAPMIEQKVFMVPRVKKGPLLEALLADKTITRAVVFTRTKHGADKLCKRLQRVGVPAESIHGNKAQNQRTRALDAFRSGRSRILVATDVAARGLDVDNISHVFNFDLPHEPEAYVHRIGRTGRAGATGIAISFCDQEEFGMLRDIERLTGKQVPRITQLPELPDLPPKEPYTPESERSGGGYRGGHGGAPRGNAGGHRSSGGGHNNAAPRAPRQNFNGSQGGSSQSHSAGGNPNRSSHPNAGGNRSWSHAGKGNRKPRGQR